MKRDNDNRKEERKVENKIREIQIIIKEDQMEEDKEQQTKQQWFAQL